MVDRRSRLQATLLTPPLQQLTGEQRWEFRPNPDLGIMNKICCGAGNRGVAVSQGRMLYQRNCAKCHANASGGIPDLLKMNKQAHHDFLDIVLKGIRAEKGMRNFREILSEEDALAIHTHLIKAAWDAYHRDNPAAASHKPETALEPVPGSF